MAAAYEPPVADDRGPLVIRPSWRALGRWEIHVVAFIVVALLLASLKLLGKTGSISWVVGLVGIASLLFGIYAVYLTVYMLGTSITVTADAIVVRHWFQSAARVAASDIVRVVRLSLARSFRDTFARPAVFAFSANGRCVLSQYAERWGKADLDRIWRHLGVSPEGSWENVILERDLSVEFPGAF
jgi:hypothetical protein